MSQVPPELARVERACRELTDAGQEITFPAVAAHASIGRATLYRRPELRAVVEEHRAHARDAHTLSGLPPRSPSSARPCRPSPPTSLATRKNSAGCAAGTAETSAPGTLGSKIKSAISRIR